MNTIKKYAYILNIVGIIFIATLTITTYLQWLLGWNLSNTLFFQSLSTMPFTHRLLGLAVDTIGLLIILYGLITFIRLMNIFQTGQLFSPTIAQIFNTLSKIALCWALYNPLQSTLLILITTLHKGPGNRILSLSVGTSDLIHIFIFSCCVLITALIKEAYKVQQEHDLTV